jgi:hypothetical protein
VQNRQNLDRGLISQEFRDLFARFPKYPGITNYFLIGNPVHRVHARRTGAGRAVHRGLTVARTEGTVALSPELGLRPLQSTEAHRRGCNRERGTWGTRRAAHRGASGGVAAGRQRCRIEGGGARWKLRSSVERREERAGEVRSDPGVVLAFYRGRGELGVEMPVSNGRRFTAEPLMAGEGGINGESRRGVKGL